MADESDRRESARIPIDLWVEENSEEGQTFRRGGNLSRGGLHLDQTIPLLVGSAISLSFVLPGDTAPVMVTGEIVSTGGPGDLGMGVKFVSPSAEAQERIDAFLKRQQRGPE